MDIRHCCWNGNKHSTSQPREIVDGLIALIKIKILLPIYFQNYKGPDFPTGGELIHNEAIKELYKTGKGSITIRGVINSEEINLGK